MEAILQNLAAKSPIGIKIGKEAFHDFAGMSLEETLDTLAMKFLAVASTDDAREGIKAFLEKRPPKFTRR